MLTTPAWILVGMSRTLPGVLSYDDDRLRFATDQELIFDAAPGDIKEVKWPVIYMGGGCKLTIDGESYRVSFVKPNGAPDITDELLGDAGGILGAAGSVADLKEALGSFGDVKKGRAAGKAWKELLAGGDGVKRLALLLSLALFTAACGGGGGGDDELSARECRDRVGQIARDVGLDKAERQLDDLVDQGCERATLDDEAAKSRGTGGAGADAELFTQGKEAFTTYITGLISGDYQVALDRGVGAASAIAGYFNTLSRIPTLPDDFKVPMRQVALTWPDGGKATKAADGTVTLDSRVEAAITGGGADEQTTYSGIKLREEEGKLSVDDFVRGEDGPVSEDVYRTETSKGEGNGVTVQMGPGFGMRGQIGEGGVRFSNFVFAFTNNTPYEVTVQPTTNNKLNFAASIDTDVKRYQSSSSAGTTTAAGATGFGFLFFNDQIEGSQGLLTLEFVDEDDDEFEVKVPLSRL